MIKYLTDNQKKYNEGYRMMMEASNDEGWGDPFSYARSKEIFMANLLGHKISKTLSGADAIDGDGECEYKSTTAKTIQGTYNGISVQPSWEEQVVYLNEKKIGKYKNHYFARFKDDSSEPIAEIWVMDCDDVLAILLPKLKKQYNSPKPKKDPRLGTTINAKEIKKYGKQIL